MKPLAYRLALTVLAALVLSPAGLRGQATYTAIAPTGATYTTATGASGSNVSGYYYNSSGVAKAFLYSSGTFEPIDSGNAYGTYAYAVAGSTVVGMYVDSAGNNHGFLYNAGKFTTIDPPGSVGPNNTVNVTIAAASNDGIVGTNIVGQYSPPGASLTAEQAFIYNTSTGTYTSITPSGTSEASAKAVDGNNVAGTYLDSNSVSHGFFYNNSIPASSVGPLNPLPLDFQTATVQAGNVIGTRASGISGNYIVGTYVDGSGTSHAYFYNIATQVYAPLDPPNSTSSTGTAISGNYIAGYYYGNPASSTGPFGFLYNISTQTFTTINPASGVCSLPSAIDGNNVVGFFQTNAYADEGFLATLGGTTTGTTTATVALGGLTETYNGEAQEVAVTTQPAGLSTNVTYNGSSTAPTAAGSYAVVATVTASGYTGSATGTLVIGKAAATITLGGLSDTYDSKAQPATATTSPSPLPVTFTYNGKATVPLNAGTYTVVATVGTANAAGTQTGTLTIAPATATVTLTPASLAASYTGKAHAVTATTVPARLPVTFTYNGSATAPTQIGSYAVVGTIDNSNYTGSADGMLVISPLAPLATTEPASSIGANTATLSGAINPKGSATTVVFQYGTSTTYGATTGTQTLAAGTTASTVSLPISSLAPKTTYYFRVVATSAGGTVDGAARAFTTLSQPTFAVTPAMPLLSASGAQVGFSVTPNRVATSVYFQYGTTTSYGSVTAEQAIGSGATPVNVTGFFGDLEANTPYYYRIVTVSAAGTFYGPQETFTTLGFDLSPVAAKGDLAPGVTNGTFNVLGSPAVNEYDGAAFLATLTTGASGVTTATDTGIWADNSSGTLTLIAQYGGVAPGTSSATFASLGNPVYNSSAGIAFAGGLKIATGEATTTTAQGIWSNAGGSLALVARQGSDAPDVTSATFDTFTALGLSDTGVVLEATLNPAGSAGITAADNTGIWEGATADDLTLEFRLGESIDGQTVSKVTLASTQSLVGGQTRFFASNGDLTGGVMFSDKSTGIFTVDVSTGSTTLAAVSTGTATGTNGATYSAFSSPIINASGNIAFEATLATSSTAGVTIANDAGIWADDSTGTLQLIARKGVNGGTTILTLGDPVYNDNDAVAFEETSKVSGSAATITTINCNSTGTLESVAQLGTQAPGCATGAKFSAFTALALPDEGGATDQGGVILLATLAANPAAGVTAANDIGAWAVDNTGTLQLIVRTGDVLPVNGVNKTITSVSLLPSLPQLANQSRSFAPQNGDLVYLATFSDGSTAIYNVVFPQSSP